MKTLTIFEDDPHSMAIELWRLSLLARVDGPPYRLEVRDNAQARGKLVPLVSYEELLRRAGSMPSTGSQSPG